jgi:hypothetical protein
VKKSKVLGAILCYKERAKRREIKFKKAVIYLESSPKAKSSSRTRVVRVANPDPLWKVRVRELYSAHARFEQWKNLEPLESSRKRTNICANYGPFYNATTLWKVRLARTRSRVRRSAWLKLRVLKIYKRGLRSQLRGSDFWTKNTRLKHFPDLFLICEGRYSWWWSFLKFFVQDSSLWSLAKSLWIGISRRAQFVPMIV